MKPDSAAIRALLAEAMEPAPVPLPEQDTRVGEAMAGRQDTANRAEWVDRVTKAKDDLVALLPDLLTRLEQAEAERDEARRIVRDLHWMARRYADGRQSYAVGMCNDALKLGYDAGWLKPVDNGIDAPFARDSMFSPEWRSIEQRASAAEAENATLKARVAVLEEALTKSRDKFGEYAWSHKSNGTADGNAKAQTNLDMAAMCDGALNQKAKP